MMKKPHVSVLTLISRKGKILMIKRGDPPHNGKWALPGGHLEFGERLEEAAAREVKEETGLTTKITKFIGFKNEIITEGRRRFHIVLFCYEGKVIRGELIVGYDVKDAAWKEPRKMKKEEISPSILSFFRTRKII
ncbi:MAG: NUDIX domain-containing protein [Nitrosotalea sp.]